MVVDKKNSLLFSGKIAKTLLIANSKYEKSLAKKIKVNESCIRVLLSRGNIEN